MQLLRVTKAGKTPSPLELTLPEISSLKVTILYSSPDYGVDSNLSQAPQRAMLLGNGPHTTNPSLVILGSTSKSSKMATLLSAKGLKQARPEITDEDDTDKI